MDQPETDVTPGEEARKTDIHDTVEDYLTARRDEHGSGTYAASAKSELDRWVNWMAERGYNLETLEERGPEILRQYATRLRQRTQSGGITASTAQTYFAYISACLSFAVREGRLPRNPAQTETARELMNTRPSMAVVGNRVARAADAETAEGMEKKAHAAIAEGYRADEEAAEKVAERLADAERVVTLSRSGTVAAALDGVDASVTVAESLPGGEGAEFAVEIDADRTVPDACVVDVVRDADAVVVGADSVLRDGTVVNKVGSLAAALAAERFGVPFIVIASTDKISPDDENVNEYVEYGGERVPVFERVPADLVEAVTEKGTLTSEEVREHADEHARQRTSLR